MEAGALDGIAMPKEEVKTWPRWLFQDDTWQTPTDKPRAIGMMRDRERGATRAGLPTTNGPSRSSKHPSSMVTRAARFNSPARGWALRASSAGARAGCHDKAARERYGARAISARMRRLRRPLSGPLRLVGDARLPGVWLVAHRGRRGSELATPTHSQAGGLRRMKHDQDGCPACQLKARHCGRWLGAGLGSCHEPMGHKGCCLPIARFAAEDWQAVAEELDGDDE